MTFYDTVLTAKHQKLLAVRNGWPFDFSSQMRCREALHISVSFFCLSHMLQLLLKGPSICERAATTASGRAGPNWCIYELSSVTFSDRKERGESECVKCSILTHAQTTWCGVERERERTSQQWGVWLTALSLWDAFSLRWVCVCGICRRAWQHVVSLLGGRLRTL